jgi:hypothetical protein
MASVYKRDILCVTWKELTIEQSKHNDAVLRSLQNILISAVDGRGLQISNVIFMTIENQFYEISCVQTAGEERGT